MEQHKIIGELKEGEPGRDFSDLTMEELRKFTLENIVALSSSTRTVHGNKEQIMRLEKEMRKLLQNELQKLQQQELNQHQ